MPDDLHKRLQNLFSWKQLYQWQFNTEKAKQVQNEINELQKQIDNSENFINKTSLKKKN